jgi:hypothetical protein
MGASSDGADPPPSRHPRDASRTRAEARIAFLKAGEEDELSSTRFSAWDTMSGLPDRTREADGLAEEFHLLDLWGRVKATRRAISTMPGAADMMRAEWRKEAAFLAPFGITQGQLRIGVPERDIVSDWG